METITSLKNQMVKDMVQLQDRKTRKEKGLYMIEGLKMLQEAVASCAPIKMIFVVEDQISILLTMIEPLLNNHFSSGDMNTYIVTSEILSKLSNTKTPQGIIAVLKLPEVQETLKLNDKRVLMLDRVQDPGNVGTMIRTADACGFDMVLLSEESADPWQPKALRASMGSIWHIAVHTVQNTKTVVSGAKSAGLKSVAAHPRNSRICWDEPLSSPLLLVIGNESSGVSDELLEVVDTTIMIPMYGKAESLNAANAAAMIMYEAMRQRRG